MDQMRRPPSCHQDHLHEHPRRRSPVPALTFGHGRAGSLPRTDLPYSARAFAKFPALVEAAGADRITVRIRFLSQPWHLYSGVITRGILAASAAGGAATGLAVMAGVYADRDAFEFDGHCSGANMDRTPAEILKALSGLAASTSPLALLGRPSTRRSAGTSATAGRWASGSRELRHRADGPATDILRQSIEVARLRPHMGACRPEGTLR
jgi:hypothetical protein